MNDETISIKGVKKELYNTIKDIANTTGKTIGEITNEAYKLFVSTASGIKETGEQFVQGLKESQFLTISNMEDLEISGVEIKSYGKKVLFKNIKTLKLKEITQEDFNNYIVSIINVKRLEIPKTLNKLKVLEISRFIGEIVLIE